jgi:hypothetical protein
MCSVNPNSVTTASGLNIATVAVTTTARSAAVFGTPKDPQPFHPPVWPVTLATLILCLLLIRFARATQPRFACALVLGLLILIAGLRIAGCGGGSAATSTPPPPPQTGTLAVTYTVTVTGTSGNTTRTMTLTMIVN